MDIDPPNNRVFELIFFTPRRLVFLRMIASSKKSSTSWFGTLPFLLPAAIWISNDEKFSSLPILSGLWRKRCLNTVWWAGCRR